MPELSLGARTLLCALLFLGCVPARGAQIWTYAWPRSVSVGDTVRLHVSTDAPRFEVTLLGAASDEAIARYGPLEGTWHSWGSEAVEQGCDWPAALAVPVTEGMRGLHRVRSRATGGGEHWTWFVVRPPAPDPGTRILVCLPVATWDAYNPFGGRSTYEYNSVGGVRAHVVSMRRPLDVGGGMGFANRWELHLLRWLEREDLDFDTCTSYDLHSGAVGLDGYSLLVLVGHDEYWSRERRRVVERFVAEGGNLAVLSGNTCWWQVRYSDDGTRLICYKDAALDPMREIDARRVTVRWFTPPVEEPETAFLGVSSRYGGYVNHDGHLLAENGFGGYTVTRPDHWIYEGTSLGATDEFGQSSTIVGYEVDGAILDPGIWPPVVTGEGGTPRSYEVLAIAPAWYSGRYQWAVMGMMPFGSGAVFNAATTDWVHGLRDGDPVVERITRNVVRRMSEGTGVSAVVVGLRSRAEGSGARLEWDPIDPRWGVVAVRVEGRRRDGAAWAARSAEDLSIGHTTFLDADATAEGVVAHRLRLLRSAGDLLSVESPLASGPTRVSPVLTVRPSPTRGPASLAWSVPPLSAGARLELLDLRGRRIREWLLDATESEGILVWDGTDGHRRPVGAGVYLALLRVDGAPPATRRFVWLRE